MSLLYTPRPRVRLYFFSVAFLRPDDDSYSRLTITSTQTSYSLVLLLPEQLNRSRDQLEYFVDFDRLTRFGVASCRLLFIRVQHVSFRCRI